MPFEKFKAGPPRRIMAALDPILIEALDIVNSYSSFREAIVMLNYTDRGCFVKAARPYGDQWANSRQHRTCRTPRLRKN